MGYDTALVVCKRVIVLPLNWFGADLKMAGLQGQAKVINYRLIEELS